MQPHDGPADLNTAAPHHLLGGTLYPVKPMSIDTVILIWCTVVFAVGVLVHRWWVLIPLGLVWVVLVGLSLARGGLTAESRSTNYFVFVLLEVPTLTVAAAGVALGRIASRLGQQKRRPSNPHA
jgi:hypothetical protein